MAGPYCAPLTVAAEAEERRRLIRRDRLAAALSSRTFPADRADARLRRPLRCLLGARPHPAKGCPASARGWSRGHTLRGRSSCQKFADRAESRRWPAESPTGGPAVPGASDRSGADGSPAARFSLRRFCVHVAGRGEWRAQLAYLAEVAERENVTVQVLSQGAGVHGLVATDVWFLRLMDGRPVAYTENAHGGELIKSP
ncbi:Scr1 family TA system antitoxin-like transcriptional regulator [Streptomyces sp. GD-15H]|uniref:Scr1 family TA system antitoxin-like transcriptional regulator n=1 Tax=Streptomyces sp. GD-15H TaxID=3129112 RepID=UPI003873B6B7